MVSKDFMMVIFKTQNSWLNSFIGVKIKTEFLMNKSAKTWALNFERVTIQKNKAKALG